jgi:hypothetical protein
LWGAKGAVGKLWNVLEVWSEHSSAPAQGRALDSGHYLAEEQPEEVLQEFLRFFRDQGRPLKFKMIDESPPTFILVFETGDELTAGLLRFAKAVFRT